MVADKEISIVLLTAEMATELSQVLLAAPPDYSRYFIPFAFDEATIRGILGRARQDRYWGVCVGRRLAGFFMLRGFDAGYNIPAYGVWIAPEFSGCGLATLTLHHALAFCRMKSVSRMMLKVHPDNVRAKGIYEKAGFQQTGVDEKNGHLIYHLELSCIPEAQQ